MLLYSKSILQAFRHHAKSLNPGRQANMTLESSMLLFHLNECVEEFRAGTTYNISGLYTNMVF
jgi:hypothetical protein